MQAEKETTFENKILELKKRLYNRQAALAARKAAAENDRPFDGDAYKQFVKNHPLFSKLHLLETNED